MKERGLILTKENRLASVEGRKTQTRRVIKPQPEYQDGYRYWWKGDWDTRGGPRAGVCTHGTPGNGEATWPLEEIAEHAPYQIGDHLYMLEPYQIILNASYLDVCGNYQDDGGKFSKVLSVEEFKKWSNRKKPHMKTSSRFMYKSLARYWFEVTQVRCERVQDINGEDCIAEGVEKHGAYYGPSYLQPSGFGPRGAFKYLWDSINEKRGYGWDKNPWVWVYKYKRITV